jgi:RNA polymerase sigma factor for flagellar operon FliA
VGAGDGAALDDEAADLDVGAHSAVAARPDGGHRSPPKRTPTSAPPHPDATAGRHGDCEPWRLTEAGMHTEEQAVARFRPLVRRMARSLSHKSGGDADDLGAAGEHGVLEAVRRFDPERGCSLEAYVARRAHGAMRDELRKHDRLSRRTRHAVSAAHRARATLCQQTAAEPARDDVADALGIDAVELAWLEQLNQPAVSIDDVAPVSDDDPCARVLQRETTTWLWQAIASLPERLRTVLVLRSLEERPLKELAALLGVTEPRVSQLHKAAVDKLRALLPDGFGDALPA